MRIFITGGSGFIGSRLLHHLRFTEHTAVCLTRRTGLPVNSSRIIPVSGDILDKKTLVASMSPCDAVVHLANLYSFWERHPRRYHDINITGTRQVMEAALESGVSRVIHISSAVTFGKPEDCPFNEASPPGAVVYSEYARTKREGDRIARALRDKRGLPLIILYPGAVTGPGDIKSSGAYIGRLIRREIPAQVLLDSVITWTHVDDVVQAIMAALTRENLTGREYLIGKDTLSFREFNRMVQEISGVPLPRLVLPDGLTALLGAGFTLLSRLTGFPPAWGLSADQIRATRIGFCFDGSRAERELGLQYTPIRRAIEEAVAFIRQEGADRCSIVRLYGGDA
jgi:dihydroflavonol-4-reductase